MLKKAISVLLALMVLAGCAGALAEEDGQTFEMPSAGMKIVLPQEYADAKGLVATDGVIELGSGSYTAYFYYCAASREEYDRLLAEAPGELSSRMCLLFYAFAIYGDQPFSEVTSLDESAAVKLGQEGDYTFYLYMNQDAEFAASAGEEFGAEFTALTAMKDQVAAGITCYTPVNEYTEQLDGTVIRFTAKDLDGNPVSSEELFSRHEVTMVNVWATWCGPCVSELADLQEVHTHFLEKDCAVVGLLTDDDVEKARRLMAENGVEYDVVLVSSDLTYVFPYSAIPTTFFVDRNGAFLGTKFVGVCSADMYESALTPFLK